MKPTVSASRTLRSGATCERLIGDKGAVVRAGTGKPVQQRRLADVRVADERDEGVAAAPAAARFTLPAHVFERTLQQRNALLDLAAVDFEFRFAGTARSDAAPQSRERGARTDQVRLPVAQLGQFDLQLPFARASVLREDVEDEHRAVDNRQRDDFFEVRPLARTQVVEHEQHVGVQRFRALGDLVRLTASDERCRIDVRQLLHDLSDDSHPGGLRQRDEFGEFGAHGARGILQIDADDERALGRGSRRIELPVGDHTGTRRSVAISHARPSL
jgi:hypothetical protein